MIQTQGWTGIWHNSRKFERIVICILKGKIDPFCLSRLIGFSHTAKRNLAPVWIADQLTDGTVKHRTRCAQKNITDIFFPDQLMNIGKAICIKTGLFPDSHQAL